MSEDVIVTFGASTSGLSDGLDEARAETEAAADDIRASVEQVGAAFASMGKDQLAVTMAQFSGDMALARQSLSEKLKLLGEETQVHEISADQKRAATQAALQEEYIAERNLLDGEMQMDGLRAARKQQLTNQMLLLDQRYNNAVKNLGQEAVNEEAQRWESLFSTIEGAFDSQLRGLLAGTTRWATAFKNILADLVIKFIEMCEKMVVQWAVGELARTAATTAGNAARTSANEAGAASGLVANFAAMVRSIAASAAETFAGIFGFLAPVMGPAAAGPAAAGQAAAAAAASAVPSYDVGAWSVPADTLAMVHAGETILPAGPAAAFRNAMSGGGGGGATGNVTVNYATHFNVQALDSADVKRWFKNNAKTIMGAVDRSISSGAHLGFAKLNG
jgi:hypothetical protein